MNSFPSRGKGLQEISFESIQCCSYRRQGEYYRQARQAAADCTRHLAREREIDDCPWGNLLRPEDRPAQMRTTLSRRILIDEKLHDIAQPACQPGRRDRSSENAEAAGAG